MPVVDCFRIERWFCCLYVRHQFHSICTGNLIYSIKTRTATIQMYTFESVQCTSGHQASNFIRAINSIVHIPIFHIHACARTTSYYYSLTFSFRFPFFFLSLSVSFFSDFTENLFFMRWTLLPTIGMLLMYM